MLWPKTSPPFPRPKAGHPPPSSAIPPGPPLPWLFPVLARVLTRLPMVADLFSRFAGTPSQVHQLLLSTGSRIDATGEAQYLHLLRQPAHVSATLAMMAQWNLDGLLQRLPALRLPCLLITAEGDRAVPAKVSQRAAARMPNASSPMIKGYGHLVHEEAAAEVARLIFDFLNTVPGLQVPPPALPVLSS
jgi:magnesium chelatase accessory protein